MAQPGAIGEGSFSEGTRIAVPAGASGAGEIAVERLQAGDLILTPSGPVALAGIESRGEAPGAILVRAGALGAGRPRRDLMLQAEHLLFLREPNAAEGALAPAGALVNGTTITRSPAAEPRTWFALELAPHGLVMAENLPVAARRDAAGTACARLIAPGPALFALRGRLARGELVAEPAGMASPAAAPAAPAPAAPPAAAPAPAPRAVAAPAPRPAPAPAAPAPEAEPVWRDTRPSASAPALCLIIDGTLTEAESQDGALWRFTIPSGARWFRLASPPGTPEGSLDSRRFGVAITRIELDGIPLDLAGMIAGPGFHPIEGPPGAPWRWTDGYAQLVLPPCPFPRRLAVSITGWHAMLKR